MGQPSAILELLVENGKQIVNKELQLREGRRKVLQFDDQASFSRRNIEADIKRIKILEGS